MNTTQFSAAQLPTTPSTTPSNGPTADRPRPQPDGVAPAGRVGPRALVLGGGGSTGNAWLIGIVAGLADAGLDLTAASLTIGTSAGSTAAAQLGDATPAELLAATVAGSHEQPAGPTGSARGRAPSHQVTSHLDKFRTIIAEAQDIADLRRRMGAAALERDAASDHGSWQKQWRATVGSRLPSLHWPDRPVLITAVDARTGEPVVFDRDSGVDLVDAVAASCAGGGFSYGIGGRQYIDGGYRTNADNADLAAGYEHVLVLSPLSGRSLFPEEWGTHLADQVRELRAGGSRVETIVPDSGSAHLFGANAMDVSLRPSAARAGYEQGAALAEHLRGFWR